jgi:hypothetical protein
MFRSVFFILILILSFSHLIFDSSAYAAPIKEELPLDQKLVQDDKKITEKIDDIMSDVDVALAGEKLVETTNVTRITIRNQLNWPSGGPFAYNPHLDLRLHLPNLEKKWQLKFVTYNEDQVDRGINRDRLRTAPVSNDYAGSIGFFQKLGEVNAEFQPRIEYSGGFQFSYFLKLTSSANKKYFSIHPEAQFFARSDTGIGQYLAANVDIPLYKTFVLTVIDEEQYQDQANIFSTNNGLGISYNYNDAMSQNTTFVVESNTRPNYHLDRFTIASAFTHKLYKNVLHYTIRPYLAFPSELVFVGQPGINVELDLIF